MNISHKEVMETYKLFKFLAERERLQMPKTPQGDLIPAADSPRFKLLVDLERKVKWYYNRLNSGGGDRRGEDDQEVFEFFNRRT